MAKSLQRIGNSLGLIIDAPIRHALGIGTKTRLSMRTDGRRLIIEPLPDVFEPAPEPDEERLRLDCADVATRLVRRYSMWEKQYERLRPRMGHPLAYVTHAELWHRGSKATPADFQTMRRMEVCLVALQEGKTWDDAIEIALQRFPVTTRESPNS